MHFPPVDLRAELHRRRTCFLSHAEAVIRKSRAGKDILVHQIQSLEPITGLSANVSFESLL